MTQTEYTLQLAKGMVALDRWAAKVLPDITIYPVEALEQELYRGWSLDDAFSVIFESFRNFCKGKPSNDPIVNCYADAVEEAYKLRNSYLETLNPDMFRESLKRDWWGEEDAETLRTSTLRVRVSPEEKRDIELNAYKHGYAHNISDFIRGVSLGDIPVVPNLARSSGRNKALVVKVTATEKDRIEDAAKTLSLPVSEFVRNRALGKILQKQKNYV